MIFLIISFLCLIVQIQSNGNDVKTEFYVDVENPTGNECTKEYPCDLQHALEVLPKTSHRTIIFSNKTPHQTFNHSYMLLGVADEITFTSEIGVTLGMDHDTTTSPYGGVFRCEVNTPPKINFENIKFESFCDHSGEKCGLFSDYCTIKMNVTLKNFHCSKCGYSRWNPPFSEYSPCYSDYPNFFHVNVDHLLITDSTFVNSIIFFFTNQYQTRVITISNNTFFENARYTSLHLIGSQQLVIEDNTFMDSGSGIFVAAENLLVRRNKFIWNKNAYYFIYGGCNDAVEDSKIVLIDNTFQNLKTVGPEDTDEDQDWKPKNKIIQIRSTKRSEIYIENNMFQNTSVDLGLINVDASSWLSDPAVTFLKFYLRKNVFLNTLRQVLSVSGANNNASIHKNIYVEFRDNEVYKDIMLHFPRPQRGSGAGVPQAVRETISDESMFFFKAEDENHGMTILFQDSKINYLENHRNFSTSFDDRHLMNFFGGIEYKVTFQNFTVNKEIRGSHLSTGNFFCFKGHDYLQLDILNSYLFSGDVGNALMEGKIVNLNIVNSTIAGVVRITPSFYDQNLDLIAGFVFINAERSSLSISDSIIDSFNSPSSGGAISLKSKYQSVVDMKNTIFQGNVAVYHGGALRIFGASLRGSVKFENVTMKNNKADFGGALWVQNVDLSINSSKFTGNEALHYGGAIFSVNSGTKFRDTSFLFNTAQYNGGAISFSSSTLEISGCSFQHNFVSETANSNNVGGGSIYFESMLEFSGKESIFKNMVINTIFNSSYSMSKGGDVYFSNSLMIFEKSNFSNSASMLHGGAISCEYGYLQVKECDFRNTSSSGNGGAVFVASDRTLLRSAIFIKTKFEETSSLENGGAVFVDSLDSCFYFLKVINSKAKNGGGIYLTNSKTIFGFECLNIFENGRSEFEQARTVQIGSCDYSKVVLDKNSSIISSYSNSLPENLPLGSIPYMGTTQISSCEAAEVGGGIFLYQTDVMMLEFIYIQKNTAQVGGGIFNNYSTPEYFTVWAPLSIYNNKATSLGSNVATKIPIHVYTTNNGPRVQGFSKCVKIEDIENPMYRNILLLRQIDENIETADYIFLRMGIDCLKMNDSGSFYQNCQYLNTLPHYFVPYYNKVDENGTNIIMPLNHTGLYHYERTFYSNENIMFGGQVFDSYANRIWEYYGLSLTFLSTQKGKETMRETVSLKNGTLDVQSGMYAIGSPGDIVVFKVESPQFGVESFISVVIGLCGVGYQPGHATLNDSTCVECFDSSYKLHVGQEPCKMCPTGSICRNNVIEIQKDFWGTVTKQKELVVRSCKEEYCGGGKIVANNLETYSVNNCTDFKDGPICRGCLEGYSNWNDDCRECTSGFNILPICWFFVYQFFILLYFHLTTQKQVSKDKSEDSASSPGTFLRILFGFNQILFLVVDFKMWAKNSFFYQGMEGFILSISNFIQSIFQFTTPQNTDYTRNYFHAFTLCPFYLQGVFTVFFQVLMPFLSIFVVLFMLLIFWVIRKTCCKRKQKEKLTEETEQEENLIEETETPLMESIKKCQSVIPGLFLEMKEINQKIFMINESKESSEIKKKGELDDLEIKKKGLIDQLKRIKRELKKLCDQQETEVTGEVEEDEPKKKEILSQKEKIGALLSGIKNFVISELKKLWIILKAGFTIEGFFRTLVNLLIVTHFQITISVFDFFICSRDLHPVFKDVMLKYTTVQCYNPQYFIWGILVFLPLLIYCIFGPIVIVVLLFKYRKNLFSQESHLIKYFEPIYELYKPEYFYFEIILIFKKLLLIICINFSTSIVIVNSNYNGIRYVFTVLIISICFAIQISVQPFKTKLENIFETIGYFIILTIIGLQEEGKTTKDIGMILSILISFTYTFVLIFWSLYQIKFVKNNINKILDKCSRICGKGKKKKSKDTPLTPTIVK